MVVTPALRKRRILSCLDGRDILCDCHCGPMYYFPVSLTPEGDFVMCWVSECGRCYKKLLEYFHLRATRPTLERINEDTRSMALCPNESCPTCSSMAITRTSDASRGEDETCWYCFDSGTEFPRRHVGGLFDRLLQILDHQAIRDCRPSITPVAFPANELTSGLPGLGRDTNS
jgi:hypothetical protein